jgi:acyl-CoA oxidase
MILLLSPGQCLKLFTHLCCVWLFAVGQTANYAVVVAQIYTKGVCHGIHPFIVQLRDEKTHRPMPGVTVGEIGPKLGMNATNNGFLAFKQVPVPRNQMLMKNAQVLPVSTRGKFTRRKVSNPDFLCRTEHT